MITPSGESDSVEDISLGAMAPNIQNKKRIHGALFLPSLRSDRVKSKETEKNIKYQNWKINPEGVLKLFLPFLTYRHRAIFLLG